MKSGSGLTDAFGSDPWRDLNLLTFKLSVPLHSWPFCLGFIATEIMRRFLTLPLIGCVGDPGRCMIEGGSEEGLEESAGLY